MQIKRKNTFDVEILQQIDSVKNVSPTIPIVSAEEEAR